MIVFILAFLLMLVALAGMALGVILNKRPITTSCALACGLCHKPCPRKKR